MLLDIAAHNAYPTASVMCTLHFVMVYVLWRCTLCDIYVLKNLRFETLTLCATTFFNITSRDAYVCCFTLCSNIQIPQPGFISRGGRGGGGDTIPTKVWASLNNLSTYETLRSVWRPAPFVLCIPVSVDQDGRVVEEEVPTVTVDTSEDKQTFETDHDEDRSDISILFFRFLPEFWCSNISAMTRHTRKYLKVEYLGRLEYDFKNLVLHAHEA